MLDKHDMLGYKIYNLFKILIYLYKLSNYRNMIIIYCKKEFSFYISDIYHESVKYGFMNKVAEYGGVSIHFKVF